MSLRHLRTLRAGGYEGRKKENLAALSVPSKAATKLWRTPTPPATTAYTVRPEPGAKMAAAMRAGPARALPRYAVRACVRACVRTWCARTHRRRELKPRPPPR